MQALEKKYITGKSGSYTVEESKEKEDNSFASQEVKREQNLILFDKMYQFVIKKLEEEEEALEEEILWEDYHKRTLSV